jgi:hypothetical protein
MLKKNSALLSYTVDILIRKTNKIRQLALCLVQFYLNMSLAWLHALLMESETKRQW